MLKIKLIQLHRPATFLLIFMLFGITVACNSDSDGNNQSAIDALRNSFADEAIFNCILEKAATNGWTEPAQVDELLCPSKGIVDIGGIENLTELTYVNFHNNEIADITPLIMLTKLVNLNLEGNQKITDYSPLANMTQLEVLNLRNTEITTLPNFKMLTQLQDLNLSSNDLDNTSGLENIGSLINLEVLNLDSNNISDAGFLLSPPTKLRYLSLIGNKITDASAFSTQTTLDTLILNNNQIDSGLSALQTMTNFTLLGLRNNWIQIGTYPQAFPRTIPCDELTSLLNAMGSPPIDLDGDTSESDVAQDGVNCTSM